MLRYEHGFHLQGGSLVAMQSLSQSKQKQDMGVESMISGADDWPGLEAFGTTTSAVETWNRKARQT